MGEPPSQEPCLPSSALGAHSISALSSGQVWESMTMTPSGTFSRLAPPQLLPLPYSSASIPTRGPALCMSLEVLPSVCPSESLPPHMVASKIGLHPLGGVTKLIWLVLPTPPVIASGQKLGFTHHRQDAFNFDLPNVSVGEMCLTHSHVEGRSKCWALGVEWETQR